MYTVFMKRKAVSKIISDCGVFVKRQFEGLSLQKAFGYLGIEVAFILLFLAADLLTKRYVYGGMVASGKDIIIIKEVLRLTPVQNTGASFGIFQGHTDILSVVSVVTLFFVAVFMIFSLKNRNGWLRVGLVILIAGGIGNLIDRFTLGYVRDFIYFELINFAVFNVADSGLTVGVVLILIYVIFYYRPEEKKPSETRIK